MGDRIMSYVIMSLGHKTNTQRKKKTAGYGCVLAVTAN